MNSSVRHEAKGRKRYNGWVSQRITTTQIHLPVLTAELIKRQVTQENKICEDFRKSKILTFDDMSAIRHRVSWQPHPQALKVENAGMWLRKQFTGKKRMRN